MPKTSRQPASRRAKAAGKPPAPAKPFRVPALRVDPEKYPNLPANPSLERALRIRQALDQGKPRDEAVALADLALGPRRSQLPPGKPRRSGRPASGPRQGGEAERPRRKPMAKGR